MVLSLWPVIARVCPIYLMNSDWAWCGVSADNLMLRSRDSMQLVMIDFGLSVESGFIPVNVHPTGSQAHWSPEKAASKGYDLEPTCGPQWPCLFTCWPGVSRGSHGTKIIAACTSSWVCYVVVVLLMFYKVVWQHFWGVVGNLICFIANFLMSPLVKTFWKSVNIWQSYRWKYSGANFFQDTQQ